MIPKRTLTATLEISTGNMIITNRPPAFTGEADALMMRITLLDGGVAYTPVGNVIAKLYLYWQGTQDMSEAVDLTISGNLLSGALPDTLTAVPGCPLLVIQLTDTDSGDLVVAAATPIQITNVLGERVISPRPATPSEIIYVGRSPYIDTATGHWMQWDVASSGYIDTGVSAAGRPATFTATATTLPAGSAATASISGTPDAPSLNLGIPKGDTGGTGPTGPTGAAAGFGTPTASVDANVGTPSVTVSASGPDTAKVFDFAFHNLKGKKGDTGGTGPTGPTGAAAGFGTPTASVDANVGTPSVAVSASGPDTAKVFSFAFHNLKGQKGDTGDATSSTAKGIHMSPTDTTTIYDAITDLKGAITDVNLLDEMIMGTVQTISFDQIGNVSQIVHSKNGAAVRTDVFTFGTGTITEVRTLAATGESVTITTNTATLETTVVYAAA